MFDISKYLERFTNLDKSRTFLADAVCEAIKEVCGFEIDLKNIEVKNGIARIKEKSILKMEIFLKKEKIMNVLKDKANGKVHDIL